MAGYPRNLFIWNNNNVHGSSQASFQRPQRFTIACRYCDQAFVNNQALINHLGLHMNDENHQTMRPRRPTFPGRHQFFHPYQRTNLFMSMPPPLSQPGYGPWMNQAQQQTSAVRPTSCMVGVGPSQVIPRLDGNFGVGLELPKPTSLLETQHAMAPVMEEPDDERTKPLIQQLDHPYVGTSSPEDNGDESGSTTLELTLKLSLP